MVKLYEPRLCEGDINMVEMGNGDWVSYDDYEKLKADRDYWYEKCLDAGLLDEERAADRKEQD